ncbi:hypothetical protein Celaphus_00012614 [Cervus elaphus hippelaphus]|uniref:Uncharacterized protein n=1 Tax=Cervus elaphus hippelaphus TaxID=46360 RepID=A0A212CJL5_CEREH|nr:hypothetical protein Celaphus_00012614 [Cervus elaphus hippelaphus]
MTAAMSKKKIVNRSKIKFFVEIYMTTSCPQGTLWIHLWTKLLSTKMSSETLLSNTRPEKRTRQPDRAKSTELALVTSPHCVYY